MCQHCDDAPCQKAAPDAVIKRDDGIVIINPVKSKGRREIYDACPFGAVWWNDEKDIPQHWIFDAHLLDRGWKEPRCETSCATAAFKSVKVTDEEMQALAEQDGLERRTNGHDINTRVYYKNLWRFDSDFIAGTLSSEKEGIVDCIADAQITLTKDGAEIATTSSDAYGDFKFDKLHADGGDYTLEISAKNHKDKSVSLTFKDTDYLGDIQLKVI